MKRRLPGRRWRLLALKRGGRERVEHRDDGQFDELVVEAWLHVEQIDTRDFFVQLGPLRMSVHLRTTGETDVIIERDFPAGGRVHVSEDVDTAGESLPVPDGGAWWGRG